jgi:hypothetical protein
MRPVRISVLRLTRTLLLCLAVPLLAGLFVDRLFGTGTTVMVVVGFVCIPLAAFFVSRAVLSELDKVIQVVAPEEITE